MIHLVQPPCNEAIISARASTAPCQKSSAPWILAATILGSSMAFIDGTVVNVALASLQSSLNATVTDVQWVVESYALLLTALLLVGGSMGDHFGRRRMFLIGVAIFAGASLCCGFAADVHQLIAARAIQGAGAALLVPGSLAIIGASFREEDRGRAIGTWAGFTAITAAIGPVLGGWLIEHFSWRGIFFINLPLALVVWLISMRHLAESRDESNKAGLDWIGAALITTGLGCLVYGLIESSRLGFNDGLIRLALAAAAVLLTVFLFVETAAKNPMLPLGLFRSRNFSGANLLTLFLYSALGGTLFFLPLNLIQVQGYTPIAAGAALLPFVLLMFLLSRWSGGLVKRYGSRTPLIIGPIVAAAGFLLFARPGIGPGYWRGYFPAVVILGLGMTISVAPLTTTVMNAVSSTRMGVASGINNAVARAAGLLAIAVFGIIMVSVFNRSLDGRLSSLELTAPIRQAMDNQRIKLAAADIPNDAAPLLRRRLREAINESFLDGFRTVMLIGGGLAVVSGLTSLLLINPEESRQHRI